MPPRYWLRAWKTVAWMPRLFGRTSKLSQAQCSAAVSTWLSEATPVSRFRLPAEGAGPKTLATSGHISERSSRQLDLLSASSRTSADTLPLDSAPSKESWRSLVSRLSAEYSQRLKSAQRTGGNGCSSWPTPDAAHREGDKPRPSRIATNRKTEYLGVTAVMWPTARADSLGTRPNGKGGKILADVAQQWPTATTMDSVGSGAAAYSTESGRHAGTTLTDAMKQWATPKTPTGGGQKERTTPGGGIRKLEDLAEFWRTPSATEADHGGPNARDSRGGAHLSNQAQWATPAARDHKGANGAAHLENGTGRKHMDQLANQVAHGFPNSLPAPEIEPLGSESSQSGQTSRRRLNPRFVEWLQNFPIGWTEIELTDFGRSETQSCQPSQNTRCAACGGRQ